MATPQLVERSAQPFVAIRSEVKPTELSQAIDSAFSRLFAWLGEAGIPPAGAPFIRYKVVDMERKLHVELGVPIAAPVEASGDIHAGSLPAGRYAVSIHQGPYSGLRDANAALLQSAKQLGVEWDTTPTPDGEAFAARLETYLTDPSKERDPAKFQTELAIKTR
jgi:effector-binding domain-containing protein